MSISSGMAQYGESGVGLPGTLNETTALPSLTDFSSGIAVRTEAQDRVTDNATIIKQILSVFGKTFNLVT